jgi:anaerobic ribonucleoside-triphosphate reductase
MYTKDMKNSHNGYIIKILKKVPCSIMTRTVGYYANVDQMNKGKQEEVRQRKLYNANKIEVKI